MKLLRIVFRLVLLGGAAVAPARAQLVHLSLPTSDLRVLFHADSASLPLDLSLGTVTRFDLYYDPTTLPSSGSSDESDYAFSNPSKNFWRMRVESVEAGTLDIVRPLDFARVESRFLTFRYNAGVGSRSETLDLVITFDQVISGSTDFKLPLPPFPPLYPRHDEFGINAVNGLFGSGRFNVPHLTEIDLDGEFRVLGAEIVPVPEPATYAIGAVVLLGVATLLRRRPRPSARLTREMSAA